MIVLAGATGHLGGRVAGALLQRGAGVIALVRYGSAPGRVEELRKLGATIEQVDRIGKARVQDQGQPFANDVVTSLQPYAGETAPRGLCAFSVAARSEGPDAARLAAGSHRLSDC